jgi:hypothetical protein
MNSDLQLFVREALSRGLGRDAIRDQLRRAGWREAEVEAGLRAFAESDFPIPVPQRRASLNAREAFLYLVLFATLYTTAFNVGQVLFALIERSFPDTLISGYDYGPIADWARGAVAGLIIAFPVFLLLSRIIGGSIAREPDRRGSPVRKWLTYLTLFLAALVILGDLTALVWRVLGGELAPRFLLKVGVVFAIAGTVFWHYLSDLRREEGTSAAPALRTSWLARGAAAAVIIVTMVGIFVAGSPGLERERQLDGRRIENLRQLEGAIDGYFTKRGQLPTSIAELLNAPDALGRDVSIDPVTLTPYAYTIDDSTHYRLCATFSLADRADPKARARGRTFLRPESDFWRHEAGEKCFTFEVTKPRVR